MNLSPTAERRFVPEGRRRTGAQRALAWIIVGGLALRLGLLLWWEPEIASDAADYVRIANDIVNGRGFIDINGEPSSFRAPAYPLLLSGVFRVFGTSTVAVRVLQSCLDMLTVVVVYHVAARTLASQLSDWVAPIAAGLVAINFGHIATTQRILSETLFTFLFTAAVAASVEWWRSERPAPAMQWAVATGFLFGAATLTRGVMIAYPLVLIGVALAIRGAVNHGVRVRGTRDSGTRLRGTVVLLCCFVLTLAPWTLRNYRVHQALVPVSTQIGITLYASYNPPDGKFGFQPSDAVVRAAERLPEAMASRVLTRAAIDTAFANPQRTLRLEGLKTLYFWSPVDWELLPRYGVVNATYLWIVLLAFLGLGVTAARRSLVEHWPLLLPVAYLFGMALVFHGSPRYRLPAEPLLAIAAAATIVALSTRYGIRVVTSLGVALLVLACAASVYSDVLRAWVRPWVSGS